MKSDCPIRIKVLRITGRGKCSFGLKRGDEFVFDGRQVPAKLCSWAFHVMFPVITALRFGGNVPWEKKQGMTDLCCLDPKNPVVFRVERIKRRGVRH